MCERISRTAAILDAHPKGSLDGLVAIAQDYITYAIENSNIFKLMFSQTRAHDEDDEIMKHSSQGFGAVRQAVGDYFGCDADDKKAVDRSFMMWSFVHGLAFIVIDEKSAAVGVELDMDTVVRNGIRNLLSNPEL